jgi:succinate dehydrogenase hydrophobic anchor subunit
MTAPGPATEGRLFADLTAAGRSSFDWAVLFAAVALVFPVSGFFGVLFAARSRRKGYGRWRSALAITIWCMFLGIMLRGLVGMGVFP